MNPRIGVPLMVALLLASSWAFSNEETVNDWVRENQISTESEEQPLLGMQNNETWLVLLADFQSDRASEAWGPEQAQYLLDDVATAYIGQVSGNQSQLNVVVDQKVTTAINPMESYGTDVGGNRDTDASGQFQPVRLAEEVVLDHASDVNWSQFDLNSDGIIDRLLILHTTKGQEETPGQTNKIWSHFTRFEDPIPVAEGYTVGHYTMASLRTGSSGTGIILHEMMHQMGALDLYPVHEANPQSDWQGVGNWDIMASGNWNGGGAWPALPTAASLELIGLQRSSTMDLTWPSSSVAPCVGPTVEMVGMSEGGLALRIQEEEQQVIWIEHRTDFGFDSHLPGHGILVTMQDRSVGDEERNELNRDADQPWLAVLEADGRDDLRKGTNDGEASDLFTNGTSFGAQGVLIRDHDGFLVPWTATVSGEENLSLQFSAANCTPGFSANGPDFGAVLLPSEPLMFTMQTEAPCTLNHSLTLTDGRGIVLEPRNLTPGTTDVSLQFGWNGTANSESILQGTITCGIGTLDLSTKVLTLARIPVENLVTGTLLTNQKSTIMLPIESTGTGSQSFTLDLDGPMSRVATIEDRITLTGEDELEVQIAPNNLLENGMRVRGELVLIDSNGHRWMYELEFTAQTEEPSSLEEWRTPGRILGLVGLVAAVWVLLGMTERKKKPKPSPDGEPNPVVAHETESKVFEEIQDPWGRPVDNFD